MNNRTLIIVLAVLMLFNGAYSLRTAHADTITEGNLDIDGIVKDVRTDIDTYIVNQDALSQEIREIEKKVAGIKRGVGVRGDQQSKLKANAQLLKQYSRLLSANGLMATETIKVVDTLVDNFEKLRNHMQRSQAVQEKVLKQKEYQTFLTNTRSSLANLALNLGDANLSGTVSELLSKHDRMIGGGKTGALDLRQQKISAVLDEQIDFLLDVRANALLAKRVIAQQQAIAAVDIEHFKASMALMSVKHAVKKLGMFQVPNLNMALDDVLEMTSPKTMAGGTSDTAINTEVLKRFANPESTNRRVK